MPKAAPDADSLVEALLDRMSNEKLNVHETARLIGISAASLYKYNFYSARPGYKNSRLIAAWLKMPMKQTRTSVEENLQAIYRGHRLVAVVREILDYLDTLPAGAEHVARVKEGFAYTKAKSSGDFNPAK